MFTHGQKVKRVVGNDGCFPALGNIAFVEKIIDEELMTLQGCGGNSYLISSFVAEGEVTVVAPQVHEIVQSVAAIDKWNRTCPTSQMISIEAHCAQDGGSVFMVGKSFDTNNAQDLFDQLVQDVSKGDLKVLASQFTAMVQKL